MFQSSEKADVVKPPAADSLPQQPAAPGVSRELALAIQWIARQSGKQIEFARVQRVLTELEQASNGEGKDDWRDRIVEAGRSLGIHFRSVDCTPQDLQALLATGGAAIALVDGDRAFVGLRQPRRRQFEALWFSDQHLERLRLQQRRCWSVVIVDADAPKASHHPATDAHGLPSPLILLWRLLRPEMKDIVSVVAISGVAGLLLLSVPVTAQQLVRAVTFATLYQPIIVLSLVLLALLGFVAALQTLHIYIAEVIQRRLFARVASRVARHLPWVTPAARRDHNLPELMNRFLDVGIIQKSLASLIVDGIAIALSTAIGMSVMAFYHPFLLGYDLMLLLCLAVVVFILGRGGTQTAIQESKAKYHTLAWLQDLAASCGLVQEYHLAHHAAETTDLMVVNYLKKRQSHFRILLRQILVVLGMQALATTTLLGLGGYLVLQEQLTLGQLVAAELIVATIVASFAKLGKHIESWYDLLAAVDKVAHLTDLPVVTLTGTAGLPRDGGTTIELQGPSRIVQNLDQPHSKTDQAGPESSPCIAIAPGCFEVLHNLTETDRTAILQAFIDPSTTSQWSARIDGLNLRDLRPDVRWQHVAILDSVTIFPGTVAENVHLHRADVTDLQVHAILRSLGLLNELEELHLGLDDRLGPGGFPLSVRQLHKLLLARVLAGQPRLIVLDHWCDVFGDDELRSISAQLPKLAPQASWLILTSQRRVVELFAAINSSVRQLENSNHA